MDASPQNDSTIYLSSRSLGSERCVRVSFGRISLSSFLDLGKISQKTSMDIISALYDIHNVDDGDCADANSNQHILFHVI